MLDAHSFMNSNALIAKAKLFFLSYKWLLFPLVPIIIFVFIIFYIFNAQKNPPTPSIKQQNNTEVSQTPRQTAVSPQTEVSLSPSEQPEISPDQVLQSSIDQETNDIAAGKLKFADESDEDEQNAYPGDDEVEEGSINTKTLPDGSIEYEYSSDDPNMPDMQILKDNVVVFRRNMMPETKLTDYSDLLSNPEYTSQGSNYYGANAIIYASPTKGIAVVTNPQTEQVYEQYLFQAMSVNDYLQKYGKDISAYSP